MPGCQTGLEGWARIAFMPQQNISTRVVFLKHGTQTVYVITVRIASVEHLLRYIKIAFKRHVKLAAHAAPHKTELI
jgi:hypothetical protein